MEKRIGAALIVVENQIHIQKLNNILTNFGHLIIGRQGIPLRERGISVISIVIEGSTDEIGALTGQIGRLEGIRIKSVLMKDTIIS